MSHRCADEDEDEDEEEEEFSEEQLLKLPPVGPPSWDSNVVCIQPTRNHSRPEGHEEAEEKQNNNNNVSSPEMWVPPLPDAGSHFHISSFVFRSSAVEEPRTTPTVETTKCHV